MYRSDDRHYYNSGYSERRFGSNSAEYPPMRCETPQYRYQRQQNSARRLQRYNSAPHQPDRREAQQSVRSDCPRPQQKSSRRADLEIASNIVVQQREMRPLIEQMEPAHRVVTETWD